MDILLTNDDGIYSEGIMALYDALKQVGKVTVVAPDTCIKTADLLYGRPLNLK